MIPLNHSKKLLLVLAALLFLPDARCLYAAEKIKIVTTTSTFASVAQEIAGEKAEIYAVASPNQNIHFITPTPKDVLKTRKADVFIHAGLDLESAWRSPLWEAAGREEFINGERGIDVSKNISLLAVPENVSRSLGDIHVFGNPHFWLDPENGETIAATIAERLAELYPEDADFFKQNAAAFKQKLDEKIKDWQSRLSPYKNAPIVVYHDSWPYFFKRFNFETFGSLEPKPGIPPTPKHIKSLVDEMKSHHVTVIVKEVFHEKRTPKKVAAETGASVVDLATETGEIKSDYAGLFEHNVQELEKALKK